MTYLICYDIIDNALRNRIAKRLERAGCQRVQKSVFIAPDFEARRIKILRGAIAKLIPPILSAEESVLVFPIERDNLTDAVWAGERSQFESLLDTAHFKLL